MFCFSVLCVSTALVGLVLLLTISYWFKSRNNHYWKVRNVQSDAPVPFIGNYFGLFKGSNFFHVDQEWYKRFGRIFGSYEGFMPILFVGEPEHIRNIFVKDFNYFANRRDFSSEDPVFKLMLAHVRDDQWQRIRSVITPAFSTGKLKKLVVFIRECVDESSKKFLAAAESGETIDTKRLFGTMALDVIASAVFGTKINSASDPNSEFVKNVAQLLNQDYPWRMLFINMMPKLAIFLGIKPWDSNVTKFFMDVCKTVLAKRREQNIDRPDFLQALLDARKNSENPDVIEQEREFLSHDAEGFSLSLFQQYSKRKVISEDEAIAQCVQFLSAGYDSTATVLALIAYYLALYPECQEKLVQEVDQIWQEYSDVNYEAISATKYMDQVISETLRIAPPGVRLSREANQDYKVGDTGITVPKGMSVVFPVYAMHHDPEFFPDPERFDPDRFSTENRDKIIPYSYLPFGSGPRHCIGMRLAMVELKTCLLCLLRKVTFKRCAETDVPLKIYKGAFQFQPKMVALKVVKRNIQT